MFFIILIENTFIIINEWLTQEPMEYVRWGCLCGGKVDLYLFIAVAPAAGAAARIRLRPLRVRCVNKTRSDQLHLKK